MPTYFKYLQIGLIDCYKSAGVRPSFILGYSIGEIASAYASNNITATQAILIAYHVGKVLSENSGSQTATAKIGM